MSWPINSQVMFSYRVSKKIYNGLSFLKLKPGIYSKSSLIFGSFLLNLEDQTTLMKQHAKEGACSSWSEELLSPAN